MPDVSSLPQLPVYALNAPAGPSPKGIVVLDGPHNKMAKQLTKHPLFHKLKAPKTRPRSHAVRSHAKRPKRYF